MGHNFLDTSYDKIIRLLSILMRHSSSQDLTTLISTHQELRANLRRGDGLGSLVFGILDSGGAGGGLHAEILSLLTRLLRRPQVNWIAVLTVTSVVLATNKNINQELQTLISDLIEEGLANQNTNLFLSGLLLARHACLDEPAGFSSYAAWFHQQFCAEDSTANLFMTSARVQFFYQTLTTLVPIEPEFALRAQVGLQPRGLAVGLRPLAEEYRQLVRTQLLDTASGLQAQQNVNGVIDPSVRKRAKEIIEEWSGNGKIPGRIQEASMFRQPYYVAELLPAIMTAFTDNDPLFKDQTSLVDTLHCRGKVPPHLYKEYKSGALQDKFSVTTADKQLCNMSHATSAYTVENLAEHLDALVNLPLNFRDEVEQCLTSIKHIVSRLLTSTTELRIEAEAGREDDLTALEVYRSVTRCLRLLSQTELKSTLGNLVLDNKTLLKLTLKSILTDCDTETDQALITCIFNRNPAFITQLGQRTELKEFFCSNNHIIRSSRHLERTVTVLLTLDEDQDIRPPGHQGVLCLWKLRLWSTGGDVPVPARITLKEFARAISTHLSIQSDPLPSSDARLLLRELLKRTEGDDDSKIRESVKLMFATSSTDKHKCATLLSILGEVNLETLIACCPASLGTDHEAACLVIQELQKHDLTQVQGPLLAIVEQSRRQADLLHPASAVELLGNTEPDLLPPALRVSTAFWDASELVRSRWSSELRRVYPGVYGWVESCSTGDHAQSITPQTIQFGFVRLAELYLRDEVQGLSVGSRVDQSRTKAYTTLINRLQKLVTPAIGNKVEKCLLEPTINWFGGGLSLHQSVAVQIMLVRVFCTELTCSLQFLLTGLLPITNKLESMKALPAGELGELNRLLVNRVKAFSKQDVRDAIQNNRLDSVDSDLYVVLTQYLEE